VPIPVDAGSSSALRCFAVVRVARLARQPRRRDRGDAGGLVRIGAAAARHRRQQRRNGVADAGRVVLGGPARERDHFGRHERLGVEHAADRLDVCSRFVVPRAAWRGRRDVDLHDDPRNDPRPERHDDARADLRRGDAIRHGVGQEVEVGNWDSYMDEQRSTLKAQGSKLTPALSVESSDLSVEQAFDEFHIFHTSRFDEGLRRR
jgi:hypothetical protein